MDTANSRSAESSPEVELSIVVPTYMERQNVGELIERMEASLKPMRFELIVVDDASPDGTAMRAEELNKGYGNIRVVSRAGKLGLSSAILEGFERAGGNVLAAMDADLQHPPELLLQMLEKIREGNDLVIGSRYTRGGKTKAWGRRRRILSRGATALAHTLLPRTRGIKDVMSGFFMLRRDVIEGVELSPVGFKILLEIIVRGNYQSVAEVPYTFEPRRKGASNLNLREIWRYMVHIRKLLWAANAEPLRD